MNSCTVINKLIKTFDVMRFPLAIFVIILHTNGYNENFRCTVFNNNEVNLGYFIYLIIKDIARVAVPCFYVISGFFFFLNAKHFTFEIYKTKLCARFKSLFLPYMLWNLITFIALISKEFFMGNYAALGDMMHWNIFISSFWLYDGNTTPISAPLWFLRDLIIVVALTPIIYKALKTIPLLFLGTLIVLFCTNDIMPYYQYYPAQIWTAPLFFSIGAYFVINSSKISSEIKIPHEVSNFLIIVYVLFLIADSYTNWKIYSLHMLTNYLVGVLCTFVIFYKLAFSRFNNITQLNKSCFFLFALHFLIINSSLNLAKRISYDLGLLTFFIALLINIVFCLTCFYVSRKLTPKLTSLLSGGRA